MEPSQTIPLGDAISSLYEAFLSVYGDEELASVATAAVVNEALMREEEES